MKQKISHRAFLGVFLGVVALACPYFVKGASIFGESFESYATGNLTSWDTTDIYYEVVNSGCAVGDQCLYLGLDGNGWGKYQYKNVSNPTTEISYISVWIKASGGTGGVLVYPFNTNGDALPYIGLWNNQIKIGDQASLLDSYSAGNWYEIQMEMDSTLNKTRGRYKILGGSWNSWSNWSTATIPGSGVSLAQIRLQQPSINTTGNMDNIIIGEGNAPDEDELPPVFEPIKTLDFQQPPDETSTPDFSNWILEYVYYTGTTTPESLLFNVGATTESGTTIGTSFIIESVVPDSTSTKYVFVPKTFTLPGDKWYYGYASMGNVFPGEVFATSTSHFVISTTSSAIWQIPPESTSTELTITCDPESPFFERSLCKLAVFLFIPNIDDFDDIISTWDAIKNKIPLGYLTISINSLETLTTSTTASISFSSLGEFTDYIKDFFTAGFWIIFAFWCFNRIKNLEI